MSGKNRLF